MKHIKKVSATKAAYLGDITECAQSFVDAIMDAFKALVECVFGEWAPCS